MRTIFFFFTLLTPLFLFSEKDPTLFSYDADKAINNYASSLVNCDGLPSLLVHGCVNTISGDYVEMETDIILAGSQPLPLERYYSSSDHRRGSLITSWNHNHWGLLKFYKEGQRHAFALYRGNHGGEYVYKGYEKGHHANPLTIDPRMLKKGITNCTAGEISGRTNIKNNQIEFSNSLHNRCCFDTGRGDFSYYSLADEVDGNDLRKTLTLRELKKANGFSYQYNYFTSVLAILSEVGQYNRENQLINKLSFHWHGFDDLKSKKNPYLLVVTPDGRQVAYTYKMYKKSHGFDVPRGRFVIEKAERTNGPTLTYTYEEPTSHCLEKIIKKSWPDGRFLEIEYYKTKNEVEQGKVKFLKAPLGDNGSSETLYRFEYKETGKKDDAMVHTLAFDALNHLAQYNYSKETQRISYFQRFKNYPDFRVYSQENFTWGTKGTKDETQLIRHTLQDGDGKVILCRQYDYDERGNIENNWLVGNIRGLENNPLKPDLPADQQPAERFVKKCRYSNDNKNLLLESDEHGFKTLYEYHGSTDLLKTKLIIVDDQVKIRELFYYDSNAAVTSHLIDDGCSQNMDDLTGVTQRTVKEFINNAVGLPESICEYGIDKNGQKILIRKTVNHYDGWGRLEKQDTYDDQNNFSHSHVTRPDYYGNIIEETNALGETIHRTYDINGNLTKEIGPKPEYIKEYTIDSMNRLTHQTIKFKNSEWTLDYGYDRKGNKVWETDLYGNMTTYEYDELDRLIKITKPPILTPGNQIHHPQTRYDYDILGHLTSVTDPHGNTTRIENTVLGKPYSKHYPDGTHEKFEYSIRGELKKEIAQDGSYTLYEHDYLQRPTKITVYDKFGTHFKTTVKEYTAFHLIKEIDPEGQETCYQYDYAGRLSEVRKGQKRQTLHYDSLGRLHETRDFYTDEDYLSQYKNYDLLDRVIEEGETDRAGNIYYRTIYKYDEFGNKILIQKDENVTTYTYDIFGQVLTETNSNGEQTQTEYHYNHKNDYGVKVAYSETKDPLGRETVIQKDSLGNVDLIIKKDENGKTVQQSQYIYDLVGNRSRWIERVITPDQPDRLILTAWIYDCMDRVKELAEAVASQESKVTYFEYDEMGNLRKIKKPNGIEIVHVYDPFKNLLSRQSSDLELVEFYEYDNNDNLIRADENGNRTLRIFKNDNLVEERLANGFTFQYEYDPLDRLIKIVYPDQSEAHYGYDAFHLKEVIRQKNGETLRHQYVKYDPQGHLIQAKLPGPAGEISYEYDRMDRLVALNSPGFTENNLLYDSVGNILQRSIRDAHGLVNEEYTYDALSQIKSEKGIISRSYVFDSLSNDVQGVKHYNEINQLLKDEENSYEYDLNGNLIKISGADNVLNLVYDPADRLIEIKDLITYEYDALNRRIKKKNLETGEETRYLFVNQNEVGAVDSTGKTTEFRVLGRGKGGEVGAAVLIELGETSYVPLHDHQGNCVSLLELNGKVKECYRYTAFGQEELYDGVGETLLNCINAWRYGSKRHDPETSFIYFGERYYYPKIGRWITPDPLGFVDSSNLYAFVKNNPLVLTDIYGLSIDCYGDFGFAFDETLEQGAEVSFFNGFGKGLWNGFSHYLGTSKKQSGMICDFGSACYEGDFSNQSLPSSKMTDTAGLLGERTGEVLGQAAFVATAVGPLYQLGKTAYQNLFFTNINKGVNLARVSTSSAESTTKNCFNSSNFQKRARFSKLEPRNEAQGVHTSFKYNSTRSRINGYETYEKNTFTGEWDRVIRFRGEGKPHGGFNPPYILERSPGKNLGSRPKVPRKPEPWELPSGY